MNTWKILLEEKYHLIFEATTPNVGRFQRLLFHSDLGGIFSLVLLFMAIVISIILASLVLDHPSEGYFSLQKILMMVVGVLLLSASLYYCRYILNRPPDRVEAINGKTLTWNDKTYHIEEYTKIISKKSELTRSIKREHQSTKYSTVHLHRIYLIDKNDQKNEVESYLSSQGAELTEILLPKIASTTGLKYETLEEK